MRDQGISQQVTILNGTFALSGTIVSTTTKNNSDTAVPFTLIGGRSYLLQPDAACYIKPATTAALAVVTSATGLKIAADEKYVLTLGNAQAFVGCLSSTGSSMSLKVFELT